jgi:AraC-like DNA-binding protein
MAKTPTYRVVSNPVSVEPDEWTVLFAGESQTRSRHRSGPKVTDYYLLHHVLTGRGRFYLGDFDADIGPGDSFLIPPGQLAIYEADESDPWRYRWVAFAGSRAPALVESAGLLPSRPVVHTGADRGPAEYCRKIAEVFQARERSASLAAGGYLLLLLSVLQPYAGKDDTAELRPKSHGEELVRQVAGYLTAQYAEPVTIEGMAEALGYNRAYLSRLFKEHTGLTPAAFLAKHRADQGRRLLRERPELTVEQVAFSAGFHDPLYFSKQFKRWYGQSPTDYRQSVAQPD